MVGNSYKDNGKTMHLDRGCLTSITLYCFRALFHLPVNIPWAPPCACVRTL